MDYPNGLYSRGEKKGGMYTLCYKKAEDDYYWEDTLDELLSTANRCKGNFSNQKSIVNGTVTLFIPEEMM